MLPLPLPFPLSPLTMSPLAMSTEVAMQALMTEALNCLNSGKYKVSYELYIEALLSATKEFKKVEFTDQCTIETDLSSVFIMAHTCLKHAKDISLKCTKTTTKLPPSNPPPIPHKPSSLSTSNSPPPLPTRPSTTENKIYYPTEMKRVMSKPEYVKKPDLCNFSMYSFSDESYIFHNGFVDDEDDEEYDEDSEVETNIPIINKNVVPKIKRQTNKRSSTSLKIITNKSKLPRRSSTPNISNSAPPSPITAVSNPLNAVKSFLSLPGSMIDHPTNGEKKGLYSTILMDSYCGQDTNDIFLLANGTIDPHVLVAAQTSNSDSLSTNQTNHGYLPMIPQAPLVTLYQSLQKQLDDCNKSKGSNPSSRLTDIQSSLNRVRNIHMSATTVPTILQFQPVLIAYQLTLIDSTIFRNIPVDAILSHTPKTPHPSIVASTDFFNYLTRLIEHAILLQQEASGRAQHINHWIKVAGKCHELKNYQTLKAIISALGTPPIQRLKRSWQFIPKKSLGLLDDLSELMSEASNYGKYRGRLGLAFSQKDDEVKNRETEILGYKSSRKNSFSEPTVPFLGIFIHDMTYLVAAQSKKKVVHNSDWKISQKAQEKHEQSQLTESLRQDARVSELLRLFKNLQRSPPYSPNLSPACIKDLNKNRKRKIAHALTRTSAIKKGPTHYPDDDGGLSIEMQQCLVTQYLLTRSWVSEKTVDELSLVREPTKASRSYSLSDALIPSLQQITGTPPPLPPNVMTASVSLTTHILRNSSGSMTSASTSSNNSRPMSLDDDEELDKKSMPGSFWLFAKKNVDPGALKAIEPYGTIHRSPRHFSFEELGKKVNHPQVPMQREGSQTSLASSIFRKEFWKSQNSQQQQQQQQQKGLDMQRKLSSTIQPSLSSSTTDYRQVSKTVRGNVSGPHPLDSTTDILRWE